MPTVPAFTFLFSQFLLRSLFVIFFYCVILFCSLKHLYPIITLHFDQLSVEVTISSATAVFLTQI